MKRNHVVRHRYLAGSVAVLIVAAAIVTVIITKHGATDAAPAPHAPSTQPKASPFSFNGTADWRQGPSNETSMALFSNNHACFTSAEYKTGTVDVAAELQKNQDITLSGVSYPVTPLGTQTLTIQTKNGPKSYELHQSAVTTPPGALFVKGGQEFGYLQLGQGYLKIIGYCDKADDLPTTLPALQAIKFSQA